MPIYEYMCEQCGHAFEHLARTLADGATQCPKCGAAGPVKQFSTFSTKEGSGLTPCSEGACPAMGCGGTGSPCGGGTCPL